MSVYLYNKNNEIYCEPLHKTFMPEMAVCAFDTEDRAKNYALKAGLKPKDTRIRKLTGAQEMLVNAAVNDLKIESDKDFMFLPVHNKTVLALLNWKTGEETGIELTSHGYRSSPQGRSDG